MTSGCHCVMSRYWRLAAIESILSHYCIETILRVLGMLMASIAVDG